jgi:hypothetical protein
MNTLIGLLMAILPLVSTPDIEYYTIRLATTNTQELAIAEQSRLHNRGFVPINIRQDTNQYQVLYGLFDTEQEAMIWSQRLQPAFVSAGIATRPQIVVYGKTNDINNPNQAPNLPLSNTSLYTEEFISIDINGNYVYPWEGTVPTQDEVNESLEAYIEDIETSPSLLVRKIRRHLDISSGAPNAKLAFERNFHSWYASSEPHMRINAEFLKIEYSRLLFREGRSDITVRALPDIDPLMARSQSQSYLQSVIAEGSSNFSRDMARYVYAHWLMFDGRGWVATGSVTNQQRVSESISLFHTVAGSPYVPLQFQEQSVLRIAALSSLIGRRYETFFAYRSIAKTPNLAKHIRIEAMSKMYAEILTATNSLNVSQTELRSRRYIELGHKILRELYVMDITSQDMQHPRVYHHSGIIHVMGIECFLWGGEHETAIAMALAAADRYPVDFVRVLIFMWLGKAHREQGNYQDAIDALTIAWNTPYTSGFANYNPKRRVATILSSIYATLEDPEQSTIWSTRALEQQ